MKRITSGILLLIFVAWFSFFWNKYNWAKNIAEYLQKKNNIQQTEYVDEFEKKLREDYPETWIEIQDFTLDNIPLRFAHVFYGKTFLCTSWKLFAEYKWEIQKIYSNAQTQKSFSIKNMCKSKRYIIKSKILYFNPCFWVIFSEFFFKFIDILSLLNIILLL
jgi:hypothetical protein